MYYCSIQDAWGNNFFDYNQKISKQQPLSTHNEFHSIEDTTKIPEIVPDIPKIVPDIPEIVPDIPEIVPDITQETVIEIKLDNKKNTITGGSIQNITNNYILLGLILLFIVDYFGNLSY